MNNTERFENNRSLGYRSKWKWSLKEWTMSLRQLESTSIFACALMDRNYYYIDPLGSDSFCRLDGIEFLLFLFTFLDSQNARDHFPTQKLLWNCFAIPSKIPKWAFFRLMPHFPLPIYKCTSAYSWSQTNDCF